MATIGEGQQVARRGRLAGAMLMLGVGWCLPARAQDDGESGTTSPADPSSDLVAQEVYTGYMQSIGQDADRLIVAITGGIEIRQKDLSFRADRAVLWLDKNRLSQASSGDRSSDGGPLFQGPRVPGSPGRTPLRRAPLGLRPRTQLALENIQEIYLEGHVTWQQGEESVLFAESLYQNLVEERGVILHTTMFAQQLDANQGRLYRLQLRADAIRAMGSQGLVAENVTFTTCNFGNPHFHVHSDRLALEGENAVVLTGTLSAKGNHVAVGNLPVAPLPSFSVDIEEGESLPLKRLRAGRSSQNGVFLQTLWGDDISRTGQKVHDALGIDAPFRGDFDLNLDVYTRRGVGVGPGVSYGSEGLYFGEVGSYWIRDSADEDGSRLQMPEPGGMGDPFRFDLDQPQRLRAFTINRFFLSENTRLDAEVHYLSDRNFLQEYFEREFKEEKEPESYGHLVWQNDYTRARALYRNRLNDFDTQLDSLPRGGFEQVAMPLFTLPGFEEGGAGTLLLTHTHELGYLRRHPADDVATTSESVTRYASMAELSTGFDVGPVGVRPHAGAQFFASSDSLQGGHSLAQTLGNVGARAQLPFHRDYFVDVPALSIDGLRHIVILEAGYNNYYFATQDPTDFFGLDPMENKDEFQNYLVGVRQRLQTYRNGQKVVFLDFDVEMQLFPKEDRDNILGVDANGQNVGRTAGPLLLDFVYRPGFSHPWLQGTSLRFEAEADVDRRRFDVFNTSVTVRPNSQTRTQFRYRTVRSRSRQFTTAFEYLLTDKWSASFLGQWDLRRDEAQELRVTLGRYGHDWLMEMSLERDEGEDNTAFAISIRPVYFRRQPASSPLDLRDSRLEFLDASDF